MVNFAILVRLVVFFRCILIHFIAATIIILLNWSLLDQFGHFLLLHNDIIDVLLHLLSLRSNLIHHLNNVRLCLFLCLMLSSLPGFNFLTEHFETINCKFNHCISQIVLGRIAIQVKLLCFPTKTILKICDEGSL